MDTLGIERFIKLLSPTGTRRGLLGGLAALSMGGLLGTSRATRVTAKQRRRSRHRVRPEVVGGTPVPQGTYGFMTFLEASDAGGQVAFGCGGTVIAPRFVLTAAHCTQQVGGPVLPPSAFWLGIGQVDENRFAAENAFGVVAVTQHPGWDPDPQNGAYNNLNNDLAILELDRPVPATLATPLGLVGAGDTRFDGAGQPIVVTGWGLTSDRGQPSTRLLQAGIAIISDAQCTELHDGFFNPEIMICAGEPGRSSCQGDSGGPIFVEELVGYRTKKNRKGKKKRVPIYAQTQVGISSWSDDPCDRSSNGFVRLSAPSIRDFIRNVTGV